MNHIFIFYDKSYGVRSALSFSSLYKHCSVLSYDKKGIILTSINPEGISNSIINAVDIEKYLDCIKKLEHVSCLISVEVFHRNDHLWFPFIVNSCNEICRKVTGIDVGFTFNVKHLKKKISYLNLKKNFKLNFLWERENGTSSQ